MPPKIDFDDYSHTYKKTLRNSLKAFKKDDQFFDMVKIDNLSNYVIKNKESSDILDYGCGIGKLTGLLANKYQHSQIVGYDISKRSIKLAEKQNLGYQNISFCHEFPPDCLYNFIVVANVFHHIHPRQHIHTLNILKSKLKSNGEIIVFEHNPFNPLTLYIVNNCPFDADAKLISLNRFIKLADQCQLRVKLKKYILFFPWQADFLQKIEWHIKPVPLGAQYMVTFVNKQQEV